VQGGYTPWGSCSSVQQSLLNLGIPSDRGSRGSLPEVDPACVETRDRAQENYQALLEDQSAEEVRVAARYPEAGEALGASLEQQAAADWVDRALQPAARALLQLEGAQRALEAAAAQLPRTGGLAWVPPAPKGPADYEIAGARSVLQQVQRALQMGPATGDVQAAIARNGGINRVRTALNNAVAAAVGATQYVGGWAGPLGGCRCGC